MILQLLLPIRISARYCQWLGLSSPFPPCADGTRSSSCPHYPSPPVKETESLCLVSSIFIHQGRSFPVGGQDPRATNSSTHHDYLVLPTSKELAPQARKRLAHGAAYIRSTTTSVKSGCHMQVVNTAWVHPAHKPYSTSNSWNSSHDLFTQLFQSTACAALIL